MVITVVSDVLGKLNNGTSIAATNLINSLRAKGHEVRVVCADQDKIGKKDYYIVPQRKFGFIIDKIIRRNGVVLAKPDKNVLKKALDGADVVHLVTPFNLAKTAADMAREMDKPITASFHAQAENFTAHICLMNSKAVNRFVYERYYENIYQYCDVVHYPTAFIRDEFERFVPKTNAYVVSNGVNEEFFQDSSKIKRVSDKFTILCTGRYSKEKDPTTLIKAVNASKYKKNIKVILAGDGPLKNRLAKLSRRLNVDCDFGFLPRAELISIMRGADLYVHTAKAEIEAIACMEAIVCGLVPVISNSEKSATRKFALDGNNLFKRNDCLDLAKKIEFWYEHEGLKKEYREKYKNMTATFVQSECMDKMENMMYDAVEIHGKKNEEGLLLQRRA